MNHNYQIDPDITKAETLPASFYKDSSVFDLLREKVFLKTWQFVGDEQLVPLTEDVFPSVLLDNYLTEPILLTRDRSNQIRCMTNVCTHRGNLIAQHPGKQKKLKCMYHGRRFGLDGNFEHMPEFKEAQNFPRACDDLHQFPLEKWGPLLFAGLDDEFPFGSIIGKMKERVGFLPIQDFRLDTSRSKDYLINAHWALYCDNYLEGFHIPFVHKDLNDALDYGLYTTEIYDYLNLQIGYADDDTELFELPEGHPDFGKKVGAYYYWVFPNMMFNFYPWGLSINVVKPMSPNKTKVSFISYVYDESKIDSSAGALLDKVEREDEFVVEGVQKGIRSHFYQAGRYSPKMEKGVHHFHRLLAEFLSR
ncbi:choline monooxygenase [Reichenbachiella faecimaris]|uniref:Choline monooxygenase n=1 Tax=Reichenbachiella faecimaris TaxID=692418 RepID=A0A1W2G6X0_REIFA|nr:SRPBCC family protein [Reichenbachiella faecimaris]SMD32407.1 choline monooxygenase [Reichenbachiella faecimaris]